MDTTGNRILIYGLADPRTEEIRYVGQTSSSIRRGLQHIHARDGSVIKRRWINDLKKHGMIPRMIVLDWVQEDEATDFEMLWFNLLFSAGFGLTNAKPPKHDKSSRKIQYIPPIQNKATLDNLIRRPPVKTTAILEMLDRQWQETGTVAEVREIVAAIGVAKSTASEVRKRWLEEHDIEVAQREKEATTGSNGHQKDEEIFT